jgi:CoA-transferase family III
MGIVSLPLAGLHTRVRHSGIRSVAAGELLYGLGARVEYHHDLSADITIGPDGAHADLVGTPLGEVAGLPAGTLAYASGVALAGAALLALLGGSPVAVEERAVAVQVLLPLVLAAAHGVEHAEPGGPVAVHDGYVSQDLAGADDLAAYARMLDTIEPAERVAERVADEGQAWRLPVCPYRTRRAGRSAVVTPAPAPARTVRTVSARRAGWAPLAGVRVCDLTAMWAGPLATWLLAEAGAEVVKIESAARPDGMRAAGSATVDDAPMYRALNRRKRTRDLDLSGAAGRVELAGLVRSTDLVIDNFSRRVMPNLGFSPDRLRVLNPAVATVSMPAFPDGHPWQVAFGPGIHAMCGLGDVGDGRIAAPVVAYPDALAGLTAFATSLATLVATRFGGASAHCEVSLYECTARLADLSPASDQVVRRDPALAARLLSDPELADDGWGATPGYPHAPFASSTPTRG